MAVDASMRRPTWPWAWLACALVVRLALVAWSGRYAPFGDPIEYDQLGRSLAEHGHYTASLLAAPGSPSAFRPPGYPYWLAGIYAVAGHDFTVARCADALLGVVSVLMVWMIAGRVAGERVARSRDVAVLAAGMVLAMAPWTVRNLVVLDTFAPLGTQTGPTLVGDFNQDATSSAYFGIFRPPDSIALRFAVHHPATCAP